MDFPHRYSFVPCSIGLMLNTPGSENQQYFFSPKGIKYYEE